jgi:type III restriction enzyme
LEDFELLDNLRTVQRRDDSLELDDSLACIEEEISTEDGRKQVRFPNFSIEMETGTGKTYVYIRTALELGRRYGLKKFVVVVPSVAVREGVLKTFAVTEEHFSRLYDNMPYRYYAYDSANLTQVRQFALADSVEFMVMTLDSFNKASNVINQSTDRLQGETPIFMIQAAHPVLILDEPQNIESEQSVRALAALDPLFALRYSATHRNPYNVVYRLTPYGAYRQGLVKRIEVASVLRENDPGAVFLRLESITPRKKTLTARLVCHSLTKGSVVKEKAVTVKPGDSLEEKTGRPEYRAFEVEEIGGSFVRFANDVELDVGEERGADKEAIFEAQIRYTIEEHFRKQRRLKDAGIKVLSLFFVDRVAHYAPEDGILRKLFEKAFDDLEAARIGSLLFILADSPSY